MSLTINTAK